MFRLIADDGSVLATRDTWAEAEQLRARLALTWPGAQILEDLETSQEPA